jgi:hypothetical protein
MDQANSKLRLAIGKLNQASSKLNLSQQKNEPGHHHAKPG